MSSKDISQKYPMSGPSLIQAGLATFIVVVEALNMSVGSFVPLKSATSAILTILELCERAKRNKKAARELSSYATHILLVLKEATQNGTRMTPSLLADITNLNNILQEIITGLEPIIACGMLRRILRRRDHKSQIDWFNTRLSNALSIFNIKSLIRIQYNQEKSSSLFSFLSPYPSTGMWESKKWGLGKHFRNILVPITVAFGIVVIKVALK